LIPLFHATRGLLAYESGQIGVARAEFARAADVGSTDLIDEASVEARAYAGWLDARAGRLAAGKAAITSSLDEAQRMRRSALEARCRALLANVLLLERRPADARAAVEAVSLADLGPELQASLYDVGARVRLAVGDRESAQREITLRDQRVKELQQLVANPDSLARRASIVALTSDYSVR
jgi:plasmid stability protein